MFLIYDKLIIHTSIVHIGRGIPNQLAASNCQTTPLPPSSLPSVQNAVRNYELNQGTLTYNSTFGVDPIKDRLDLVLIRDQEFQQHFSYEHIFSCVVSDNGIVFAQSICFFKHLTLRLSQLL